ncbi:MAG: EI24 domain-containing protein [Hylemonella sp.]
MNLLFDSFWRALVYSLRPRVVALSILPLLLLIGLTGGLLYLFWETSVGWVQQWLSNQTVLDHLLGLLEGLGASQLRNVLAPLLVLLLALPVVTVLSLLAVSWFMTPALVSLVAERRYPTLARQRGGGLMSSVLLGLSASLMAALALLISMPLWLIPPLVMLLPPLIWGWLTYRVMVFDVLAEHASREERLVILRRHRLWLLAIGVLTGYLGAAPGAVWTLGAMAIVLAPLLVPVAIWIYTFVFAFSALWFAHFCLTALSQLRAESAVPTLTPLLPPSQDPDNVPPP